MLLLALSALAAATATPAAAASCAKQVVADWYDNGRVDKIYPLHCYREAIKILPVDVRDYSSAKEDISRALSFAQRGKEDPGDTGDTGGTTTTTGGGTTTTPTGTTTDPGTTGTGPTETEPTETEPGSGPRGNGDPGTETSASGAIDTSGPSSVPVPLIVLGGLALLLLAAGSIGYISRRLQARRGGEPPAAA